MNKPYTPSPTTIPSPLELIAGLPADIDVNRPMSRHEALALLHPGIQTYDPIRKGGLPYFAAWLNQQDQEYTVHAMAHLWANFAQTIGTQELRLPDSDRHGATRAGGLIKSLWNRAMVWQHFTLMPWLMIPKTTRVGRFGMRIGWLVVLLVALVVVIPAGLIFGAAASTLVDLLKFAIRPDLAP